MREPRQPDDPLPSRDDRSAGPTRPEQFPAIPPDATPPDRSGAEEAGTAGRRESTGVPPPPVRSTRGPNEIALACVLLVVVIGLALVGQDHWRRGLLLAGIGLLAGAGIRLVLPARVAGLLAVRGRIFDTVVLAVLGIAVIVLTTSVPLPVGSG